MKRFFILAFTLYALLGWVTETHCVTSPHQITIKIGAINPLTGKLATHGIEIDEGIRIAIKQFNELYRNKGLKVELIRRDDHSSPDVAINQAKQLIVKEKVVALTGGYVDSLVAPVSSVAQKHAVPYVASASLLSRLTSEQNQFFSRISNMQGIVKPVIGILTKKIQPSRVAIVFASTPGATEFSTTLKAALTKQGIKIPLFEKVRPGTPDFSSFLIKCRNKKVDFIVAAVFFPDHLIMVRQLREMKIPVKGYLGPWGIAYESFLQQMKSMADGLMGLCAWSRNFTYPGTEKESSDFVNVYIKEFGRSPTTTAMHGYASAKVIVEAIKGLLSEGKSITGRSLAKAIRSVDIVTPMGRIQFDSKGEPIWYQQVVVQIQNGRYVVIYPEKLSNGKIVYPSF